MVTDISNINWVCKSFNELTALEVYNILFQRNQIFVVEQNCVYQDCDYKDPDCYHMMGWDGELLAAYTRLLPPGKSFNNMSIGRVLTAKDYRNKNLGRELMKRSIEELNRLFGSQPITIGAQLYLKRFYEGLGFKQVGEIYLEDGIKHIEMLRF
jgi:ElaA protein